MLFKREGISRKQKTLFAKVLCSFVILSILPLFGISLFYYKVVLDTVKTQDERSTHQLLQQTELTLQNSLDSVNVLTLSLLYDSEIRELIRHSPSPLPLEKHIQNQMFIANRLKQARAIHDWITAITLVTEEYEVSSSIETVDYQVLKRAQWYQDFLDSDQMKAYTSIYTNQYIGRLDIPVFSLLWKIKELETGNTLGVLIVEMRYSKIEELFSELEQPDNGIVFVTDSENNIVYHPDNTYVGSVSSQIQPILDAYAHGDLTVSYQEEDYRLHADQFEETGWSVFDLKSTKQLFGQAQRSWQSVAFLSIAISIIAVVVAIALALHITLPLRRLMHAMSQVEHGNFVARVPVTSDDDVGILAQSFNNMAGELDKLMDAVCQQERQKREAELKALQAQINPHFLYNTLGAVRWLAIMHNIPQISEMLSSLIRLLEFSTKRTEEYVTIDDEVQHVLCYSQLLQFRYAGAFTLVTDISPEIYSCKTIRFLLQPLVENAVFHGIEGKDGGGTVTLSIHPVENHIRFCVKDDGMGMDEDTVAKRAFSGVGISNVNQRLIRYFGEGSKLHIESYPNLGTTVSFVIPYITEENPYVQGLNR